MKYKSGEEPQVGDIVRWQATGGGSWREHEVEVVALVKAGENIQLYEEDVLSEQVKPLDKGVLPIGKMDRLLVVVSRSGWERLRDIPRPFLKAPFPGSLTLVGR